jgi:threonine aldolase
VESRHHFESDNCAGICPEVWRALEQVNRGHAASYGEDEWTARATDLFRQTFEADCEVYFVFGGTAANALALASSGRSYHAVLCHEVAHLDAAECGAPEFFSSGMKLLRISGELGKVTPADITSAVERRRDVHFPKPRVISVSQPTELGTTYSVAQLKSIGETARRLGLRYHMDGARLANAVVSLGVQPAELTHEIGIDVLSFGNTKNGGHVGEAIVFFDHGLADEFAYRRKQAGQLYSKMRFIAAPWIAMLQNDTWLRHAAHANAMARCLRDRLALFPEAKLLFPVDTNAVFVDLPDGAAAGLRRRGWRLHSLNSTTDFRLMCAWDTTAEDVDLFVEDLEQIL